MLYKNVSTKKIEYLLSIDADEKIAHACSDMHPADFATVLHKMGNATQRQLIAIMSNKISPEVLTWLNYGTKLALVEIIGIKKVAILINKLDLEDIVDFVDDLDEQLRTDLVTELSVEKQAYIAERLAYPENSVGRAMEKVFCVLISHWTVGQVISFLKQNSGTKDFYALIVVDKEFKPIGYILLSTLMQSPSNTRIDTLLNDEYPVVMPTTHLDTLSYLFKRYALTVVPVVNRLGKLIGIISIDHMLHIIDEETEEDLMYLGGVSQKSIFSKVVTTVKSRFLWLFLNLITACIASIIISQFTSVISKLVIIASVMPIVSALGGNAAIQVITVVVRALAKQEIDKSNAISVITNEIVACASGGILVALVGGSITMIMFRDQGLSIIFMVAIVLNFIIAGLFGSMIPIILYRIKIDPAAASGVLVTAFTDSLGFLTFLSLAYYFLV